MKKYFLASVFAISLTQLISCGKDKPVAEAPKEVTANAEGATNYTLDTKNSLIEWKGYKILKSENTSHFGTIHFKDGSLQVKDNKVLGGKFTADVTSLTNVDLKDDKESSDKLNGHLKSADFFDVEKFPTSTFEITKVSPAEKGDYNSVIEGNLTMKGVTKSVAFNANIHVENGVATIATEPTDIKREDFGVKFQAPVENGIIKNEITLQVSVKTNQDK